MPDTGNVGVLELTIEDNSKGAGKGLKELTGALTLVKAAVEGFSLDPVGQQVVKLAKTIQEAKGTSTIIKNLGTMFNAVNKFANLKNFNIDTDKIRDMAQNMLKLADAKERVDAVSQSGAGVSDWRSSMGGIADKTKETVDSVTEQTNKLEGAMTHFQQMIGQSTHIQIFGGKKQLSGQTMMDIDALLKETKSEVEQKTADFEEIGRQAMGSVIRGIELSKEEIAQSTGFIGDYMKSSLYNNMNVMEIMDKPLEHLTDIYRTMSSSVENYKSGVDAVLPKVQKMSSEEMIVARNAKVASEAIDKLISTLDKKINYKGLSEIVDVTTGVAREGHGPLISADTTMFKPMEHAAESMEKVSEVTEGLIRVFDAASGCYKDITVNASQTAESNNKVAESMERVKTAEQDAISLMDIPASGKNGVFANANEEMQYLIQQIEQAKLSQQQFNDIAANAEKQLKYGGPVSKDELTFNLRHATEGYYQAAEAEEVYQESLRNLMTYVQQTAEGIRSAAQVTETMPLTQSVEELGKTAAETANGGMEAFKREIEEITESAAPAVSKIELLQNKIRFIQEKIRDRGMELLSLGLDPTNDSVINDYYLQVGRINEQIDRLINKSHEAQEALNFNNMKSNADNLIRDYGKDMVNDLVNNYTQIDLLTKKMEGMKQALAYDIDQNKVDTQQIAERTIAIQNLKDKIDELKKAQENASHSTFSLSGAWSTLKKGISSMFPTLTGLIKQFTRMAKMRAIRYVIRQIAAGFKEGIQNVYEYSNAIGSAFAPAMDSAKSTLAQMKNSLGAALAPVLQSLIPVLQTVINWFINAINYANQFFALLRGQSTWTRAVPQATEAFKKQEKAAKGASSAMKDLLADWDELNIIQGQNGGGGTGAATSDAEDYINMFEEVSEFDERIKNVVDYIKDHFEDIVKLAKWAGALILAWKVGKAFSDVLGSLKTIAAGVALVITGITLSSMAGESAGLKGYFDGGDILTALGGILATGLGGALIGHAIAGVPGAVAGFVIGIGVGIVALINSYTAANNLRQQKLKWGNSDYSPEQIKNFIQSQFTFDIEAKINDMKLVTNQSETAKQNLERSINGFTSRLNINKVKVQIGAKNDADALKDLADSANTVIKDFNAWTDSNLELIETSVKLMPLLDDEGNEVTEDFVKKLKVGNNSLQEYMTKLGKDIAEAYNKGLKENWGKGTEEAYLAQLERLNRIIEEKNRYVNEERLNQQKDVALSNMSYDNAEDALEEYNKWKKDYIDSSTELIQARYNANMDTAGYWSGIIKDLEDEFSKGHISEDYYKEKVKEAKDSMDRAKESAESDYKTLQNVEAYLLNEDTKFIESVNEFKKKWIEVLKQNEGYDVSGDTNPGGSREMNQIASEYKTMKTLQAIGRVPEQTLDEILQNTYNLLNSDKWKVPMSPLGEKIITTFDIDSKELMRDEDKKKLVELLVNSFDADFARKYIEKMIPAENAESFLKYLTPYEFGNSDWEKNVHDYFEDVDLSADVTPELDEKRLEQLKAEIQYYIDTYAGIYRDKQIMLNERFGGENVQKMLEDMGIVLDQYGMVINGTGKKFNPARVAGGMGISDVGWTPRNYVTPSQTGESVTVRTEAVSNQQDADNVADGTQRGTSSLLDALNSILEVARAINRKEFTVSLFPSSLLGGTNRKSDEMYGAVTGDN